VRDAVEAFGVTDEEVSAGFKLLIEALDQFLLRAGIEVGNAKATEHF
jgi:hypothetical protein